MSLALSLLLVQCACTLFMTGVIWTVQWVHYPLFSYADRETYRALAQAHGRRISAVVIPPMLLELATASLFPWLHPPGMPTWVAWLGLALVAVAWLSTFLLQVPEHQQLAAGFNPGSHRRLVRSNWLRTVAWSLRAGLLLGLLGWMLGGSW